MNCTLIPRQNWLIGIVRLGISYEITVYSPLGVTSFEARVTEEELLDAVRLAQIFVDWRIHELSRR